MSRSIALDVMMALVHPGAEKRALEGLANG